MTAPAIPGAARSRREIAAALDALAGWIADELAGGTPARWVAMQAAAGASCLAGFAAIAEHDLFRDVPGGGRHGKHADGAR